MEKNGLPWARRKEKYINAINYGTEGRMGNSSWLKRNEKDKERKTKSILAVDMIGMGDWLTWAALEQTEEEGKPRKLIKEKKREEEEEEEEEE